jgi:hypothetical protein
MSQLSAEVTGKVPSISNSLGKYEVPLDIGLINMVTGNEPPPWQTTQRPEPSNDRLGAKTHLPANQCVKENASSADAIAAIHQPSKTTIANHQREESHYYLQVIQSLSTLPPIGTRAGEIRRDCFQSASQDC